ncbi:MAG TPA: PEP-CTERM/exosortase system-associated acyltransferase [Gammaproteobacteria bacterium]|nr:PEP-CTERM/exosortase system-associated acyltransferase [Gammaproteobacteria bacterium]
MFDTHFEAILADTDHARRIHYQLRYQVYCLETGFEDRNRFPDGEEKDEWDDRAIHFLVRVRATGDWAGAVRVVLPNPEGLPVERTCQLDPATRPGVLDRPVGEISRLCVLDRYRRRIPRVAKLCGIDHLYRDGPQRQPGPIILLGLLRAAAHYTQKWGIDACYLLTTPGLARMLNRWNIQLEPAGAKTNHRGERYPFLADLGKGRERVKSCSSAIAEMLSREPAYRRFSELAGDESDRRPATA